MTARLLTAVVAKDIANQIVNRYKVLHGLPALGVGTLQTPTAKRVANKQNQTKYRLGKKRVSVWTTPDNVAIIRPFIIKIAALNNAKRAYNRENSIMLKAISRANYYAANPTKTDAQSLATYYQNIVNVQRPIVATKLAEFNAAKNP